MNDETKIVTPDAPRQLWITEVRGVLRRIIFSEAEMKAAREKAVRDFATFLATTASPKGTVQREKLQGFATEFLAYPIEEHTPNG